MIVRIIILILVTLVVTLPPALANVDQLYQRNQERQSFTDMAQRLIGLRSTGLSYALVVGVSEYEHFENLPTKEDPIRVARFLLNDAGFDYVHVLTGSKVSKNRMAELMEEYFPSVVGGQDRFLFYWSGHGVTRTTARDGKSMAICQ